MKPWITAEDRSMLVPRDQEVQTAWIPLDRIRFANREPMTAAAIDDARRRLVQNRDEEGLPYGSWPCPLGEWEGEVFVIHDGRHEKLGRMMLGDNEIFVAWLVDRSSSRDYRVKP